MWRNVAYDVIKPHVCINSIDEIWNGICAADVYKMSIKADIYTFINTPLHYSSKELAGCPTQPIAGVKYPWSRQHNHDSLE